MSLILQVTVAGEPPRLFTDVDRVLLGRGPHCDVIIDDPAVSREHCRLELDGREWTVVDTSSNGTFADGRRVGAQALPDGEVVLRLGDPADGPAVTVQGGGHLLTEALLSIGRHPDNDVIVDDVIVSRRHATVRLVAPGIASVTDLTGRDGTFVNGRPIRRSELVAGDRLTVGRQVFTFDGVCSLVEHSTTTQRASLAADRLSVRYGDATVLSDVSFAVPPGSLVAIIGPSGAGKTTLLRALTGSRAADEGQVLVDGIDLYPAYDEVRHRIGLVPQEDVLHDQLTLRQALRYAAALRLPDDVPGPARAERAEAVIAQLDLSAQGELPIHRLSGGQRKRASVAMELLTEPSLLYLDEPTSGLDPRLDREVMRQLRDLADRGRTVVVVTHSTLSLDACHLVLAMARGGRVAYFGPPQQVLSHFGATDYAGVFDALSEEATQWAARYTQDGPESKRHRPDPGRPPAPPMQNWFRQMVLLARRSMALLLSDRRQGLMVLSLPLVLAAVVQTAPPAAGLLWKPAGPPPTGAATLLVILILGAAFMGMAGSIRELVAERPIYQREWAVGLRPGSYLGSKILVSVLTCLLQAVVLGTVGLLGRDLPRQGLVLASARLELIGVLALTAITAAMAGLLGSALARRSEHTMSILVVSVMAQLVLSGGLYSIGDRSWLQALAVFSPTRWGFAAAASSADLRAFHILLPADALWDHVGSAWWFAMGVLAGLGVAFAIAVRVVLRLQEQRPPRRGRR